MTDEETPLLTVPGKWDFDYTYFAGRTASRFFAGLRDGVILGRRCPSCQRLLVPARSFCDACYVETGEWEPVGHEGTIEAFAILEAAFPGLPAPPLAIAFVTLDGSDSALLNFLEGVDLGDVDAAGARLYENTRVRVVFSPERQGRITDFHFELVGR